MKRFEVEKEVEKNEKTDWKIICKTLSAINKFEELISLDIKQYEFFKLEIFLNI